MSDYSASLFGDDTPPIDARERVFAVLASDGSSPITYYYRTSGGTRGSTTSLSSIPAGAVIERVA